MALRLVRTEEDEILRKKSKEVKEINDSILNLLDDMLETMLDNDGVGIAAVQVGILKRIIIISIEDEDEEFIPLEMINPVILEKSEETQICNEGCLSVPKVSGNVVRPKWVKVKYRDRFFNEHEEVLEGVGAIVVSHETDHLDGILFTDKATEIEKDED